MSIAEKLGITPGPWEVVVRNDEWGIDNYGAYAVASKEKHKGVELLYMNINGCLGNQLPNAGLISSALLMFEALIEDIQSYEFSPGDMHSHSDYIRNKKIIEKATNKSWAEIKELLND